MSEIIPPEFWQSVEQFNSGQFYACHDTLEVIWREAGEPERTLYQGILQIAVALYHLSNHNLRGAIILLGEGSHRLGRYPSSYGDLDIRGLLTQTVALLQQLQQVAPEEIVGNNWDGQENLPIPQIRLINE